MMEKKRDSIVERQKSNRVMNKNNRAIKKVNIITCVGEPVHYFTGSRLMIPLTTAQLSAPGRRESLTNIEIKIVFYIDTVCWYNCISVKGELIYVALYQKVLLLISLLKFLYRFYTLIDSFFSVLFFV